MSLVVLMFIHNMLLVVINKPGRGESTYIWNQCIYFLMNEYNLDLQKKIQINNKIISPLIFIFLSSTFLIQHNVLSKGISHSKPTFLRIEKEMNYYDVLFSFEFISSWINRYINFNGDQNKNKKMPRQFKGHI